MATDDEWVYTAGIIDGEGCIGIHKTNDISQNKYHLIVSVFNTCEDLVRWLQVTFGGNVFFFQESRNNPNHKDRWEWRLHRKKAADFLKVIEPFLKVKKLQAQNGIKFQSCFKASHKGQRHNKLTEKELAVREACRIVACKLNTRG